MRLRSLCPRIIYRMLACEMPMFSLWNIPRLPLECCIMQFFRVASFLIRHVDVVQCSEASSARQTDNPATQGSITLTLQTE